VSLSITTPTGLAKTKAPATPTVINKQLNQSAPNFSGKATLPAGNGYTMTIVWTWLDGGVTAEDDWEAPNV